MIGMAADGEGGATVEHSTPTAWMTGASAPLRGALLGLVLERPGNGGELTGRLKDRFGEAWRVSRQDVYRLLEGLEREGLLECGESSQAGHLVYHPTELTARALTEWMASTQTREPPRLALQAKLAVATERDAPALIRALRHHEMECLALVQALPLSVAEPGSVQALMRDSAREAMLARLQAEIQWAQDTRRRIEEYSAEVAG